MPEPHQTHARHTEPQTIHAIVVNWNGLDDTRECVRSLLAQTQPDVLVHVVDNASDGDEASALEREFGEAVRVWRSDQNLGFAGGNNLVLRWALEQPDARYLALLNNDAVADPDWLAALVRTLDEQPRRAAAASHMLFKNAPDVTENAGTVVLRTGETIPRGRGRPAAEFADPANVLGACGGAVLYRAEALREAGVFRDEFFLNFEDVDLSLRLIARGWLITFTPDAVVHHGLSQSIDKVRDDAFRVRSIRNMSFAYVANMPLTVLILSLPWLTLSWLVAPIALLLVGQIRFASVLVRGRLRLLRELRSVWRARRALARHRPGLRHALGVFADLGSFTAMYGRFLRDVVVLRRRQAMD